MQTDFSKVWLIARREMRDQLRDWRILSPMVALALGFPFFMNDVAYRVVGFINSNGGPPVIVDRLVPAAIFIIGFFPLTVALVVALEAFVGEKERGTIEPLLSSPLNGRELYLGKLIAGVFIPLFASYISIAVFMVMVSRQHLQMPPFGITAQLLALTTGHGFLMISAAIIVSIQATSVKAANLMASFIVVPVAVIMQSEASVMFWQGDKASVLWYVVVGVMLLSILLIRLGMAHFQREYLLGREIDEFNPIQALNLFWKSFKGNANSITEWYKNTLADSLRRLRPSTWTMIAVAAISLAAGYYWAIVNVPSLMERASTDDVTKFVNMLKTMPDFQNAGRHISVTYLFGHNVRTMVIILGLGVLSFSVLGEVVFVVNIALIGGVLGLFEIVGYSPIKLFAAGILPHGMFEIPALVLASASVLRLGVMFVTPQLGKSMGEIFIELLADWAKIFVGLVVPLLAIAAIIETYVTPVLLISTFK